jgi:hypothetical protein
MSATSILKKVFLCFLAFCILFVFSGLGVLAVPKPAQAQWITIKDLGKFLENLLIAIWKFAIYPLLKKIVITAVTKGDWALTKEEIQKWAIQDLAFQAANSIFKQITGISLCARINANLRLAISKFVAPDYKPDCTFDRSELVSLLKMSPDQRSKELRKKLYNSIIISMTGSNNEIGLALNATVGILDRMNTKQTSVNKELDVGSGLLATRDCSVKAAKALLKGTGTDPRVYDADGDDMVDQEWRPEYCVKKTLEGQLAETIKKHGGAAGEEFGQTLKSQVLFDLIALAKMAISSALEEHAVNPLKKWIRKKLLDEDKTELAETFTRSGENRLIEFPKESYAPEGTTPLHPDLETAEPVEE